MTAVSVAVIAGASSGIGAATAIACAERGISVALGARRLDKVEEVAMTIRERGQKALAHELDVADGASVTTFAAAVQSELGDVDAVVASAGHSRPGLIVDGTVDDLQRHLDVNVLGPQRLIEAFAPGMIERQHGDLVFVSSDVVDTHRPMTGHYNASKSALEGLVRTLQRELEGSGVRASLVRPGPTMTEMGWDWPEHQISEVLTTWAHWGLARHDGFLPAVAVAQAVMTVLSAPRGTHLATIDVQPEGPIR